MRGNPNGVAVRGLRVLRTTEGTGRAGCWSLSGLLFGELPEEQQRPFLTVYSGPRQPVARREFSTLREADEARKRFVTVVEAMDGDAYTEADWQDVLDAV